MKESHVIIGHTACQSQKRKSFSDLKKLTLKIEGVKAETQGKIAEEIVRNYNFGFLIPCRTPFKIGRLHLD